jgi:alkylated DNA repair dioxygenase AlkB
MGQPRGDTGRVTAPAEQLRIDRNAAVDRITLAPNSWVDLVRGFVRDADAAFSQLHDSLAWQQTEVLRYDHYVPEKRLGVGVRTDAFPLLHQTDLHLRSRFRVQFTGVGALLYRDGQDFQGLHSDREMRWLDDTLIAIVVLGVRRPFVLRPRLERGVPVDRIPAGTSPDDVVIMPGEGDLLVMGGACQREWLHCVPAAPGVGQPRISLTWRWTSRRGRPDTNPTYSDGRHFSDGPRQPGSRAR